MRSRAAVHANGLRWRQHSGLIVGTTVPLWARYVLRMTEQCPERVSYVVAAKGAPQAWQRPVSIGRLLAPPARLNDVTESRS
jgi:hypothetical protein